MAQQNQSLGYEALEKLLEQDPIELEGMLKRLDTLNEKSKSSKKAQEKGAFKHAALAYERFFELVTHLLEIKKQLQKK